ncbi:MAG: hypothetical protein NVSMB47_11060 [Polyangiales bacterium]
MCGIVGYIGPRACASILIDGLRKLEYRGYDSAGLAVLDTSPRALGEPAKLNVVRAVGKLSKLDDAGRERPVPGTIGIGDGEVFAASDVPALLAHTRDVIFLEDGDIAELRTRDGKATAKVERLLIHGDGSPERFTVTPVMRSAKKVDWSPTQAEKQGYKHFMLKEIHEQPTAIENTLRGRVLLEHADINAGEIGVTPEIAKSIQRVVLLACGTSHHAAIAGRNWIESIAKVPAQVELASEFRYRDAIVGPNDLVVAVSQSGETAATLAAIKEAKRRGAKILAIANVVGSAIPRVSDGALYTHAGPEIGVASTKCFTAQLAGLLMLAIYLGRRRDTLPKERAQQLCQALYEIPSHMRDVLEQADNCQKIARRQIVAPAAKDCLFLGRGLSFPIALEGALKLKEISYVHAEGYAAGEMKHGPIALIDPQMPVIVVCPRDSHYEKIASNVQEVRAREGRVIAIVPKGDKTIAKLAQDVIEIPDVDQELTPFLTVIPLQLLSYYAADLKGTDVDQPRNLAKTVTVE